MASWKAKTNPILKQRREMLYEQYHSLQDQARYIQKKLDAVSYALTQVDDFQREDELNQLNRQFDLNLKIGEKYLITETMCEGLGRSGYFSPPQLAKCVSIHFFSSVQFKGRNGTWISIPAESLQGIRHESELTEEEQFAS